MFIISLLSLFQYVQYIKNTLIFTFFLIKRPSKHMTDSETGFWVFTDVGIKG